MTQIPRDPRLDEILSFFSPEEVEMIRTATSTVLDLQKADTDPQQFREIPPIEEWIQSRYYLGPFQAQLFDFWRNQIPDFIKGKHNEWVITGCFDGETKIPVWENGQTVPVSLEVLAERYPNPDDTFEVITHDPAGIARVGTARHCRMTGRMREVWEVKLENKDGDIFTELCTPDHLWLLTDGTYKRADKLTPDDELQAYGAFRNDNLRLLRCADFFGYANVYDLEVDEFHNFALSSGVFVHNSIGGGKSTAAALCSLYKLTELSCYRYPQRLFHLADISKIVFAYLSITISQAEKTGFDKIREMLDASPYFTSEYQRDPRSNRVLRWPQNNIMFIPGSSALSVLGVDLLVLLFDEANFTKTGGGKPGDLQKAHEIYHETTDRRRSRFLYHGVDPGYSLLISSSTTQSSFTSARIKNATEETKVTIARVWDTKPGSYDLTKWFYCFVGTEKEEPFIVESALDLLPVLDARPDLSAIAKAINANPQVDPLLVLDNLPSRAKPLFAKIPLEFKDRFESDIYQALKNIAGLSVVPSGKMFSSERAWRKNIDPELRSPFSSDVITVSMRRPAQVIDFMDIDMVFDQKLGECRRHPSARRYLHFDQSASRCHSGIACVHIAGYEEDESTLARVPILELDFILYIKPPAPPDRIDLSKLRAFTFELQRLGMPIGGVSIDGWMNEDVIQIYTKSGIHAKYESVDRSDQPYLTLVNVLYGGRLRMYQCLRLKREIFNLDWDQERGKVYKPDKNMDGSDGSKDGSDAVAGAVWSCLRAPDAGVAAERRVRELADAELHYPRDTQPSRDDWILPPGYKGFLED